MRRAFLLAIGTASCVVAAYSGGLDAGAQTVAATPATTHIVFTSSNKPIPATRTFSQVKHDPSATTLSRADGRARPLSVRSSASPDTGVPSGYTLVEQSKSTYIYMSKPYYMDVEFCSSECVQQAEVAAQVRENVTGGDSKNWTLTEYGSTIEHENGAISWTWSAIYHCGINVKNNPDHICVNGATPSDSGYSSMTPGEAVGKRFETINSGIDYPMVGIRVNWSTGGNKAGLFREWDTCNSTNSTLCASSGTGN